MRELITKKERKRRLWTIILCGVLDVLAIGFGAWSMNKSDEIKMGATKEGEGAAGPSILSLTKDCRDLLDQQDPIRDNKFDFAAPFGLGAASADTQQRYAAGEVRNFKDLAGPSAPPEFQQRLASLDVRNRALKDFLDLWGAQLSDNVLSPISAPIKYEPYLEVKKDAQGNETIQDKAPANPLTITKLIELAQEESKKLDDERAQMVIEREKSYGDARKDMDTLRKDKETKIAALPAPIGQLGRILEEQNAGDKTRSDDLRTAEQALVDKRREKEELFAKNAVKVKGLKTKLEALTTRVRGMKEKVEEEIMKADADGRILQVNLQDGTVMTSLARESRVFNFTRFSVFSIEKGMQRVTKGEIELMEFYDTYSIAHIERMKDATPFKAGDYIWSPRYNPKVPNFFVVAGRLTKYSLSDVRHRLIEYGDVFQDRIDDSTQYCIVGAEYEDDPLYLEAKDRGLRVYAEGHLYRYLNFPE